MIDNFDQEMNELKRKLLDALPSLGTSEVIAELKRSTSKSSTVYNTLIQIEIRLKNATSDNWKGVLTQERFDLIRNQITENLISIIQNMDKSDFFEAPRDSYFEKLIRRLDNDLPYSIFIRFAIVGVSGFMLWWTPLTLLFLLVLIFPALEYQDVNLLLIGEVLLYGLALLTWLFIIYRVFSAKKVMDIFDFSRNKNDVMNANFLANSEEVIDSETEEQKEMKAWLMNNPSKGINDYFIQKNKKF